MLTLGAMSAAVKQYLTAPMSTIARGDFAPSAAETTLHTCRFCGRCGFSRPSCRKVKSAQEMYRNPSDRNEQEVPVLES